ncbi:MAG: DegV family EDD domain-containing protein [Spirochaetales bacterium]|nr:DegV family EDD domain-containing protein [Spirochaetales bacterium]
MVLIADSACQLNQETLKKLGIRVVDYPMYLNGKDYPVSMDMSREDKEKLRLMLKEKENVFSTSGLKEEDLLAAYREFTGEKIISIHQASSASTVTMNTIKNVASEHPDLDITYVDAGFLTAAYSVIVQDVALAIQSGASLQEVLGLIDLMKTSCRHLGVVYDLFYLHRTGRIGLAKAVLGTAMKILALLSSAEEVGTLKSIGKAKNSTQVNQRFLGIIKKDLEEKRGRRIHAVISVIGPHEKEAEDLKRQVEALDVETRVEIHYTNHSNMAHIGPDFYDIGYIVYA